jgi:hypothetical protein
MLHCWQGNVEEAERLHGFASDEWAEAMNRPSTCMLARDHAGPHKWMFDGDICVSFSATARIVEEGK